MPSTGGKTLTPLAIPDGPLIEPWMKEAVNRLNMIIALRYNNQPALTFGDANANLSLNTGTPNVDTPTVEQLQTIVQNLTARLVVLETGLAGATISATCNGDGTMSGTLTLAE